MDDGVSDDVAKLDAEDDNDKGTDKSTQETVDENGRAVHMFISFPNVVKVLKVQHSVNKAGRKLQQTTEHFDLFDYQKQRTIDDNFCKKDRDSQIQMKFTCVPCRTFLESVSALKSHLNGTKHVKNASEPQRLVEELSIENGKCKWKGKKRQAEDENVGRLSKRERTRQNKIARSIPLLPQDTDEKYNETETYFENGLRKVKPYYFTFTTHAKGRWIGMKMSEVFNREFRAMTKEQYDRCIERGVVMINGEKTTVDYHLCNNDLLSHIVHRHELPVVGEQIKIIHHDDQSVVVDKPASMPVHPCGRYRHNTVLFILAKEHGLKNLHTIHRLDRLTSGVLMFGKSASKAREMEVAIRERNVTKEYICRVSGEFPVEPVTCTEPIEIISYKIGVCRVSGDGKPCQTDFTRLDYRDGVSLVSCRPKSGRMHQIRVHLQYLGHPITNDPLYNSEIFGPEKGKNGNIGKTNEELIRDLIKFHTIENWINSDAFEENEKLDMVDFSSSTNGDLEHGEVLEAKDDEKIDDQVEENVIHCDKTGDKINDKNTVIDENCAECKTKYKDPPPSTLVMYLHALRYSGEGWSFETEMPSWAKINNT